MYHKKTALWLQQPRRALHEIREPRRRFMSGNRFRAISVGQSALPLCIRRVAGHKLHTAQKLHALFVAEVFYLSAKKVYTFLKAVQLRAARRPRAGPCLDFHAHKPAAGRFVGQDQRNDAGSRPKINCPAIL